MKIQTLSSLILKALKSNRRWWWGGQLEDAVHRMSIHKASSVSRVARVLAEDGLIEVDYKKVKGVGRPCVMYRFKTR